MYDSMTRDVDLDEINPRNLLRYYLRGLETLFTDEDGTPWGDHFFWWCLSQGLMRIEEESSITVIPARRVEMHDHMIRDYDTFILTNLDRPPVHCITSVSVVYPSPSLIDGSNGGYPYKQSTSDPDSGAPLSDTNIAYNIPMEWIRIRRSGQLQIVPSWGGINSLGAGMGSSFPFATFDGALYVPQMWRIEYIGGFYNSRVPMIVADALFKSAAIEALTVLSDTVRPPGATSFNLVFDGVQRSYQIDTGQQGGVAAVFSARIRQYRKDLYGDPQNKAIAQVGGMIQRIRDRYQGIMLLPT